METNELSTLVYTLGTKSNIEEIADALGRLDAIRDLERELRTVWKERMIEFIQAHGELVIGCKRYYVGTKKVTKVRDKEAALKAMLTATGGDIDMLATTVLSSDAFKPGECRKVLTPAEWDSLFEVSTKPELKDGKPAKELLEIDERFVGKARRQGKPEEE